MQTLPKPLRGIVPPMITPLRGHDELDYEGMERLIEHILSGGVHGLFVLGTTGEGPSLSYRLRQELIERACSQVDGRVPVLVGITDSAFAESVNLARRAAEAGAQGLVLAPPYYFPASQAEVLEYLQHMGPQLPLPLMLYNMPVHTKIMLELDTVRRALDIPNVAGVKDSSSNMIYVHKLCGIIRERAGATLLVGPEELLAESVMLGGHGGVNGGANMFPRLYVALYEAAAAGNLERVRALQDIVIQISSTIYSTGAYGGSSLLMGMKTVLDLEGICANTMAEPFRQFDSDGRKRIQQHLEAIKPRLQETLAAH